MTRENRRAWEREYRKRNAEKLRVYRSKWTDRNREKETLRLKEDYIRNREKVLARSRDRYRRNREAKLMRNAEWRKAHPEKMREYTRRCRQRNLEKYKHQDRVSSHNRRAAKRKAEACDVQSLNVLSQLINSLPKMKCAICRRNMKINDRSIDHVIPLSKGGTGEIGNLQVVHRRCNAQKYAKMPHELDGQMQIHLVGRAA